MVLKTKINGRLPYERPASMRAAFCKEGRLQGARLVNHAPTAQLAPGGRRNSPTHSAPRRGGLHRRGRECEACQVRGLFFWGALSLSGLLALVLSLACRSPHLNPQHGSNADELKWSGLDHVGYTIRQDRLSREMVE
jgi:hypothetical protein